MGTKKVEMPTIDIVLPYDVHRSIQRVVDAIDTEVAGWGDARVVRDQGVYITVDRIAIPEQIGEDLSDFVPGKETFKCIMRGELNCDKAWFSWHSHVRMEATPSDKDEIFFLQAAKTMPIFVGVVVNRKEEWSADVFIQTSMGPLRVGGRIMLEPAPDPKEVEEMVQLAKKRVKKPPKPAIDRPYGGGSYSTAGYVGGREDRNSGWWQPFTRPADKAVVTHYPGPNLTADSLRSSIKTWATKQAHPSALVVRGIAIMTYSGINLMCAQKKCQVRASFILAMDSAAQYDCLPVCFSCLSKHIVMAFLSHKGSVPGVKTAWNSYTPLYFIDILPYLGLEYSDLTKLNEEHRKYVLASKIAEQWGEALLEEENEAFPPKAGEEPSEPTPSKGDVN